MGIRNRETCLAEAKRLGIEGAEEMKWPDLQREVKEALIREEFGIMDKENSFNKTLKEIESEQERPSESRSNFDYLDN